MMATGRTLVGYDKDSGQVIRRKVFEGADGSDYVILGRYSMHEPRACVRKDWFCDHILRDGGIER